METIAAVEIVYGDRWRQWSVAVFLKKISMMQAVKAAVETRPENADLEAQADADSRRIYIAALLPSILGDADA